MTSRKKLREQWKKILEDDFDVLLKYAIGKQNLEVAAIAVSGGADINTLSIDNKQELCDFMKEYDYELNHYTLDFIRTFKNRDRSHDDSLRRSPTDNHQSKLNEKQNVESLHTFLLLLSSGGTFEDKYKKYYLEKENARSLYLQALIEIEKSVRLGITYRLKKLNQLIGYVNEISNKVWLKEFYDDDSNPIKETNLIILACKHNKINVLQYLFDIGSNILDYLSISIARDPLKPGDQDKDNHTAFYYAVRLGDVEMLKNLYDYWSGNLHWSISQTKDRGENMINNFKELHQLIKNARDNYEGELDRQVKVDIHAILQFNCFQIELYCELTKLNSDDRIETFNNSDRKSKAERIKNMFLTVFRVYGKYSKVENIRLAETPPENEESMVQKLQDETTIYWKALLYEEYLFFFYRLDLNVSLLILDNLYLLKRMLRMREGTYQKIELELYHFIASITNNWEEIYLPQIHKLKPRYINQYMNNSYKFIRQVHTLSRKYLRRESVHSDIEYSFDHSQILYLERIDFQKHLDHFKNILERVSITDDSIRKEKIPNEEMNTLALSPYLDTFALQKILQYIEELPDLNNKSSQLILERALQVVGEFLKGTDESFHLQRGTQALLQLELSIETFKQLTKLRDLLSHVKRGQLLSRINIENEKTNFFNEVHNDLQEIKKCIRKIYEIRKPYLDKSLIRRFEKLLIDRSLEIFETMAQGSVMESMYVSIRDLYSEVLENLPFISSTDDFLIRELKSEYLFNKFIFANKELLLPLQKSLQVQFEKVCGQHNHFSDALMREIKQNLVNLIYLSVRSIEIRKKINNTFFGNIRKYIDMIDDELKDSNPQIDLIVGLVDFIISNNNFLATHPLEIKRSSITRCLDGMKKAITIDEVNGAGVRFVLNSIKHEFFMKNILPPRNFEGYVEQQLRNELERIRNVVSPDYAVATTKEIKKISESNFLTEQEKKCAIDDIYEERQARVELMRYYAGNSDIDRATYEGLIDKLRINESIKIALKDGFSNQENEDLTNELESFRNILNPDYRGIKELKEILDRLNFLTDEEKNYLLENIPEEKKSIGKAKEELVAYYTGISELERDRYGELIDKLQIANGTKRALKNGFQDKENFLTYKQEVEGSRDYYTELSSCLTKNIPISQKLYEDFRSVLFQQDQKSQKCMLNLVEGKPRDPMLLECFENRISLLENTLTAVNGRSIDEQSETTLVLHFMRDRKFRKLVEMLLSDITNIIQEAHVGKTLLKKSFGLLTGINLRNVLGHGNPLLEFVGRALDPKDLPTEMISKALEFINNAKLIKEGLNNIQNLGPNITNDKSVDSQIDKKNIKLIDNVKSKTGNPNLVENVIADGANVDFIDRHGKAAIHYASMSGKKKIIEVLLQNNADINIAAEKDKHRRPLHYAAMNGHTEIVEILLVNGANMLVADADGCGPLYHANQRKHQDTFRLLVRQLMKQVGYILKECLPKNSDLRKN